MNIIAKIKAITDKPDFKLDAQAIVDILNVVLEAIFGFVAKEEGYDA